MIYLADPVYYEGPTWNLDQVNLTKPVPSLPSPPVGGGSSGGSSVFNEWPVPGRICPACLERGKYELYLENVALFVELL